MNQDTTTVSPEAADAIPVPTQAETIDITDMDTFARVLMAWHESRVARLRHMLQVPADTEVTIGEATHKLEGDFRAGFTLGLHVALHEIGKLPFSFETEESTADFDLPVGATVN